MIMFLLPWMYICNFVTTDLSEMAISSPLLFNTNVIMLSPTTHFWPFMTKLLGGSWSLLRSELQIVTWPFPSNFNDLWNLNCVSLSPTFLMTYNRNFTIDFLQTTYNCFIIMDNKRNDINWMLLNTTRL